MRDGRPDKNWRQEQALSKAQWVDVNCDRCPLCGSMVCGDKAKQDHKQWHTGLDNKVDAATSAIQNLRQRVKALEDMAQVKQGSVIISGTATVIVAGTTGSP